MSRRGLPLVALGLCGVLGCLAGPRHVRHASRRGQPPGDATVVANANANAIAAPGAGSPEACPADPHDDVVVVAAAEPSPAASGGGPTWSDPKSPGPEPTSSPTSPAPIGTSPIASASPASSAAPASTLTFPAGPAPAVNYAALDGDACEATLKKRGVAYTPVGSAWGVDRPIRLTGPLHGVTFHGVGTAKALASSIYEIVDCRLALALDDFAVILAKYDVVEAVHMSIYRPASKPKTPDPKQKPGDKSRHEAALAIDIGSFTKKDGSYLSVLEDWHGHIGDKTCVAGAPGPTPVTKKSREIRGILCDASNARLFNVMLTPNFNQPHQNHFHLEVTRGVKWLIVH